MQSDHLLKSLNFGSFHETKQTQNKVKRFFCNLAKFVFEYFHDSRGILASFAKFFLKSRFRNMIVPLSRYQMHHAARACAFLPFPQVFFDTIKFFAQHEKALVRVYIRSIVFCRTCLRMGR